MWFVRKIHGEVIKIIKKLKYGRFNFKSVALGDVDIIGDNVEIGIGTYYNGGRIASDPKAKIKIGVLCAIGFNVHLLGISHDPNNPTGPIHLRHIVTGDITIGDGVWIGSNVVVLPNIKIGNYAIIGANAVVTKDVGDFEVVGGVPAKLLYTKDREKCVDHIRLVESIVLKYKM
jgi:acetyltransferase-like isoleucine patch superfamily enzyme